MVATFANITNQDIPNLEQDFATSYNVTIDRVKGEIVARRRRADVQVKFTFTVDNEADATRLQNIIATTEPTFANLMQGNPAARLTVSPSVTAAGPASPSPSPPAEPGLGVGAFVGIGVGALLLLVAALFFCRSRHSSKVPVSPSLVKTKSRRSSIDDFGQSDKPVVMSNFGVSVTSTGQSMSTAPTGDKQWQECFDDQGNVYYYNQNTGQSQWERPANF